MLKVELLGHLGLTEDGQRVEGIRNPRLVAYLLLHRERLMTREEVAFALWPDSGDAQALTNLRRELHVLRHALPEPDRFLDIEHRSLRWRRDGPYSLDIAEFESAVERGRAGDIDGLRTAIDLYTGDLIPGIYDDWIEPHRDRLRALEFEAIDVLARRLEERREYREATALLRRLIELDPLHEPAYRNLMRVAALGGDRSAGLHAYHACATALQAELGVSPNVETRTMYEQLLAIDAGGGFVQPPLTQATHRFVGRDAEWATLTNAWKHAGSGRSTLALVLGEAGIGKSRLIEELVQWTRAQGHAAVYARSYAAEGALAYAPVAAWLRAEPLRSGLARLDSPWLSEIARLLPELLSDHPELPRPDPMTESWQRQRLFEALSRAIRAPRSPLLLILDDAHWADHDTLEWLHYLLRADPPVPILVVVAARSEELTANAALTAIALEMRGRGELHDVDLGVLSEVDTGTLGADVADRSLDATELAALYRETEGQPLVIVELARGGLANFGLDQRSGTVPDGDGGPPTGQAMPPRLRAVITARLEQLTPDARRLVELAATFGRDFTFETMTMASDLEETELVRALDELWQRRIVRDRALNTYDFGHDRIRDVAYANISPVRRRLLHRRVAQALELVHTNDIDIVAGQLAAHFDAAGLPTKAIGLYERAAVVASRISANADAQRHLFRALALLRETPPSMERDQRELELLFRISPAIVAIEGYASRRWEEVMERALSLAESLGRPREVLLALNGLSAVWLVGGDMRRSHELADAALALADDEPDLAAATHVTFANSLTFLGEAAQADEQFRKALAAYVPGQSRALTAGVDASVLAFAFGAHALWLQGDTDRAVRSSVEAIARADLLDDPYARTVSHAYAAILSQIRGDTAAMSMHTAIAGEFCDRYRFAYYGEWCTILEAWAARGSSPDSADRIERALEDMEAIRALARRPYYLSLLADVHLAAGRPDVARAVLGEALSTALASGEAWWAPEIHRLLGELDVGEAAEREFRLAIDLAGRQGNGALALRAGISLARRDPEARQLLATILDSVPDPDTRERADAEGLIGAPAASSPR